MKTLLCLFLGLLILTLAVDPKIPTLPRAFEADWTISLDVLDNGRPFFQGRIATDYDKTGGIIRFEDVSSSNVPFILETSLIGVPVHPANSSSYIAGYAFYSEGRCWKIGELSEDEFHIIPDAIPTYATFRRNLTVDGELCSEWAWSYTDLFDFQMTIVVRYSDSGVMEFTVHNDYFIAFTAKTTFKRWSNNPSPDNWALPPGPCPDNIINGMMGLNPSSIASYGMRIAKNLFKNKLPNPLDILPFKGLKLKDHKHISQFKHQYKEIRQKISSQDPTPPILAQQFSTSLTYGIGVLTKDNNWRSVDIFSGFLVTDKPRGGAYMSMRDAGDVPYLFATSTILHPFTPNNITAYMFEAVGRCWNLGQGIENPDFPIRIPSDATYQGQFDVYGQKADLWRFVGETPFGDYPAQAAVLNGKTPLFLNAVYPSFEKPEGGAYFIFRNFNATEPDVSLYRAPAGPCPIVYAN